MPRRNPKKNLTSSNGIIPANLPIPYTNRQMLIPADAKYERIPDAKLEQFLSCRKEGDSDTKAARVVGVDLRAIRYWLREDQRFSDAYDDALVYAIDTNEDRVMDQCREGSIAALRMWLEAMRPDRWSRTKTQILSGDNRVQTVNVINSEDEKERILSEMPEMTIEHTESQTDNQTENHQSEKNHSTKA